MNNALRTGAVWTDLTRNAPDKAKWSGLWQVVAANPSEATLASYGVGMGNIDDTDQSASSGGQKIAELLVFDRVLTDDETRELATYLGRKWLGRGRDGYDGRAAVEWLAVGDRAEAKNPTDTPPTVTIEVPADETLAVGRLNGGRGNGVGPTVEKTGAGALTVGEAEDFGGRLAVRGGTLKAAEAKAVPTLDQLAPYMTLRLDPSDEGSLSFDDAGAVRSWANTAAYAATSVETNAAVQADATRRPTRIGDALVVAEGPDVASNCEVASKPALRLDASDAASLAFVRVGDYGATNFVWNWTDRSGRIAAIQSRETNYLTKRPFLNDAADALCNGLPVVDFGAYYGSWDNGGATDGTKDVEARTLGLSRALTNIRAVYLVLGSQAGGGQPLGCSGRSPISSNVEGGSFAPVGSANDFLRTGGTVTLETPLFGQTCANVKNGELWVNGVKQEAVDKWAPSGGYDLVELHTAGGCLANMLGNSYGDYNKGGFRLGEIIVFERPLTDREKTATRNYLLKKWFGKADAELAALPEKAAAASISGDLAYGDGSWLSFTVADGVVANPLSLAGKLTLRAGARVVVEGFEGEVNVGGKLTLGEVDSAEGLENAVIDFGSRTFSPETKPGLRLVGRRLCVCFGRPGTVLIVR